MKFVKPLVFYGIALFIGCISYIAFKNSLVIGAVLTASFLIIILSTIDTKYSIIILSFLFLGILSSHLYYNMEVDSNTFNIRLTKYNEFYSYGILNGRNVLLKGNLKKEDEGLNLIIKGKFEDIRDYEKGIVGTIYVDSALSGKKDFISSISTFKQKLYNKFKTYLGEERAALIMSLCFGEANYLSDIQKNDFKKLGVVHAISVSGFHMAIIYKVLEGVFGIGISIFVSLLYALFTGAQPATLRAFLMIFILKMSKKVFKNYDGLSALSLSGIIILTLKPYYCLDLGFILSYLSTLGIMLYYNKIRRALYYIPNKLNESISLTLSAQVFSMPYAALSLGNLSFGFIPGNIVLLPIYTVLVLIGNIALLFYKIDFIFNLLNKFLELIMLILEGATYSLLLITPQVVYINFFESCSILLIIISFILIKRGMNNLKPVPLLIVILVAINNYKFFPNIQYIDLGASDGVIIEYKLNKILIVNDGENIGNNIKTINNKFNFSRIIKNSKEGLSLKISTNFYLKTLPNLNSEAGELNLEVYSNNNPIIFTRNSQNFMDIDLKKCDIIVLPQKSYYFSKNVTINNLKTSSYDIVFNKAYPSFTLSKGKE
ncbi:ComEC/Rec2 family competence protein [Candidatus Clostridium stratigraminis]|uniref:ComEC/Rec2 family competence protein n=1 Tax=Candidatus Clostridium stratigraminis TaxID=3381661 RepID=A0ABW8T6U6_9CLOT